MSTTNNPNEAQASPAVMACLTDINVMRQAHPEWFADYEDGLVDVVADRKVLENLIATAPNEFLRGMIFGKLAMRMQIAVLTERKF